MRMYGKPHLTKLMSVILALGVMPGWSYTSECIGRGKKSWMGVGSSRKRSRSHERKHTALKLQLAAVKIE